MAFELSLLGLFLIAALIPMAALLALSFTLALLLAPPIQKAAIAWLSRRAKQLAQGAALFFQPKTADSSVRKWYTWEFPTRPSAGGRMPGSRFFTELLVNQCRYIQYHQQPRNLNPSHFDAYVTVSIPEIEALAAQLIKLGQAQNFDSYDQLCNTLAFVQQGIRYTADLSPQTGQLIEYPKYPLETLVEKQGDCEDQAILAAALLTCMGYKVALLILPPHVALGIAGFENKPGSRVIHAPTGITYLYAETTTPNWLPGEVPRQFQAYLASGQFEILPVVVKNDCRP
jgi:hypothetical protein